MPRRNAWRCATHVFVGGAKYAFLLFIVVVSVLPILWVFFSSFKTNIEVLNSAFGLPRHPTLANYRFVVKISPILRFFVNSVLVGSLGTLSNVLILAMAAYACARFQFKAKRPILVLYSLSLFLPASSLLFPLYLTINRLGLYDTPWGLILVYAGLGLPTSLYILQSCFLSIPREIEEAAYLDGAGYMRTFSTVMLPISKSGLGTAAVLQFLLCWNEFQFALVLTTGMRSRTLPLALLYFTSLFSSNYGALFAATIMIIAPSIIIYAVLQEQVVSGLAAGAIKE
jgi:raffinose/stachyose/melibiose transport system permease protein